MINVIWFGILFIGIVFGLASGNGELLSKTIVTTTEDTVQLIVQLLGMMCLWCGVMKIAEKSGLTDKLAKGLKPVLRLIFKEAGQDDKALGAIVMNITANMFGLSNAATPFGIKAMEEMDRLNGHKEKASNDMVLFLILNAACIQFVPTTVVSIRAAVGSANPGAIILPALCVTTSASVIGITLCKLLQKHF
ncbi:MAG: nucleoside recognition domain-containing protein [Clostridium sp.]|uniref:nucleoside recognition domain-containing protein n=1 Tax=Clostridium culturomicium TaxID=1499683 RepID=UPI00058CD978|nr:nucleoside recognition domain-containing protein [Clostridium culturomicium]MDU4892329.1 nucleoside recognition domain-containing protein [Clostridium sp.]MDU7085703.1 nucleoside recognition domain-containing protein [Clostridium sp.]